MSHRNPRVHSTTCPYVDVNQSQVGLWITQYPSLLLCCLLKGFGKEFFLHKASEASLGTCGIEMPGAWLM
ncbi:hypothetical protein DsansV1_C07g0069891 [Dioscorea sansibarensis]